MRLDEFFFERANCTQVLDVSFQTQRRSAFRSFAFAARLRSPPTGCDTLREAFFISISIGVIRMKLRWSCLFALFLLESSIAAAQQPAAPHQITVDDLFGVKEAHDPQLSPDGQVITFTVNSSSLKEDKPESRIWMVPTAGGDA